MTKNHFDFIIIGAGIIGLTIAREIKQHSPELSILIIEKESKVGSHASGRNSGVLHSGVYYSTESNKAKLCANSSRAIYQYCQEKNLPVNRIGKVIVPTTTDDQSLDELVKRGKKNQTKLELIDEKQLTEIEPLAKSASGRAIFCEETSVVCQKSLLNRLEQDIKNMGVQICYEEHYTSYNSDRNIIKTNRRRVYFGYLINCAGAFADKIAKNFEASQNYIILPFRGSYYKYTQTLENIPKRLIYPAPDLNMPFLGIHSITNIHGECYFGPNAMPALGRENYRTLKGFNIVDTSKTSLALLKQLIKNDQFFRDYLKSELKSLSRAGFSKKVNQLVKGFDPKYLKKSNKCGIRAQLYNTKENKLEMDFIVENRNKSTHILNAVSPAFSSSFEFSKLVVKNILSQ